MGGVRNSVIWGTVGGLLLALLAFWMSDSEEPESRRAFVRPTPIGAAPRVKREQVRELLARVPTPMGELIPESTATAAPTLAPSPHDLQQEPVPPEPGGPGGGFLPRRNRMREAEGDEGIVTVEGRLAPGSCPQCAGGGRLPPRLQLMTAQGPVVIRLERGRHRAGMAIDPNLPLTVSGWPGRGGRDVLFATSIRQGANEVTFSQQGGRGPRRERRRPRGARPGAPGENSYEDLNGRLP